MVEILRHNPVLATNHHELDIVARGCCRACTSALPQWLAALSLYSLVYVEALATLILPIELSDE